MAAAILFILREAGASDVSALLALASQIYSVNLPRERRAMEAQIRRSQDSFRRQSVAPDDALYLFVAEEIATGRVVGCSLIIARHGTPEAPHLYLRVREVVHRSRTLGKEIPHTTLTLEQMTTGATEIGGLVVDPAFRSHPAQVGKQLSFIRFTYMALHPAAFCPRVVAEIMAPVSEGGENPLWMALGHRFTHLSYEEADALSRENKEFITSLFPSQPIYLTLLDPAAHAAVGQTSPAARPARHLLEKIGFRYEGTVDPFDGGPHLWADREKILPVRESRQGRAAIMEMGEERTEGMVASEGEWFRAVRTPYRIHEGEVHLPPAAANLLALSLKVVVTATPLEAAKG